MESFLSKIIDKIVAATPMQEMHEVAVVLPNRRAQRRLLQGLVEKNGGKPMFAPQIFPMEDFVAYLSPLKVTDQVSQLMRLYSLVRQQQYTGGRFEMHEMLSWGPVFLKDISDMDMQLQDVPAIMREFAQAAKFEIQFGKENASQTDFEKMQFNDLLADLYTQYKALLSAHSEAYEGMIYRDCAEKVAEYAKKVPYKRLIFAGFYALSPSELEIVRYFQQHFQTEVYFDVDPFYCHLDEAEESSSQRETSFFIHRNCEKLQLDIHRFDFFEQDYATIPKEVKIVATSKNMRQIYSAIREVERIKEEHKRQGKVKEGIVDMSDTAVVLADESLLLPFLLSYHSDEVKVNATMGFPFESTPVFAVLQQLLAIYESVFALTPSDASEFSFSGDLLRQLWEQELLHAEKPQNVYFPAVLKYSQLPHKELFENCLIEQLSRRLPAVLQRFCQFAEALEQPKHYQTLWQEAGRKLQEVQALFEQYFAEEEVVDFAFARFSILKTLHDIAISIMGDPNMGLQVMGLLETRMMDFDHLIMMSVNEGVLPKGITYNSLLPFDFKIKFDGKEALPNYLYQDQVYAYHFFRLLQRSSDITLIYNKFSDTSLAEKSRLINQLEYEVRCQGLENVIHIEHQDLDFNLSLPVRKSMAMEKTPEVMERLKMYRFSASSLQTYISCPLRFYFQHLMKIRERVKLTDQLEAYELGTVIHALYKAAFDDIIEEPNPERYVAILQEHIDHCDEHLIKEIRELDDRKFLSDSDLNQGQWLINRQIIRETVCHYLETAKTELVSSPWKISNNEMKIEISDYPVTHVDGNQSFKVRMTGSIDRVQKDGDRVMILDYKTGRVEPASLRVKVKKELRNDAQAVQTEVEKIFSDSKYEKLFQLVVYSLMYDHLTRQAAKSIEVGIVSTQLINKNDPNYILRGSLCDEDNLLNYKQILSEGLNRLFCGIFDEKTPFTQTENEDRCKICDFLHLCGRQTVVDSRS
jgi:hypothetical protein